MNEYSTMLIPSYASNVDAFYFISVICPTTTSVAWFLKRLGCYKIWYCCKCTCFLLYHFKTDKTI